MHKQPAAIYKRSDTLAPGLAWCVARCRALILTALSAMMAIAVTGCDAKEATTATPAAGEFAASSKPVGLTLSGYNYTNRYIDQFYVNGIGGGNLHVSTATSGGTNVCCFPFIPGTPAPKTLKVKWQHGACKYKETQESTYAYTHPFFKTLDVPVDPQVPANPGYLEVHFYPDGRVEAAITEHQSGGRLHLDKDREDRSDYPRCPNDQKPTE